MTGDISFESFNQREFEEKVCKTTFVQDNESKSSYGVLRGLHFQQAPFAQSKLVRVVKGAVLDVAVDIRKGSPTFGQHVAVELTEDNHRQFFIPRGLAHGFSVLSEEVVFQYKCDNFYAPHSEGAITWDDPDLGIDWRIPADRVILSEKDSRHPRLKDLNYDSLFFGTYRFSALLLPNTDAWALPGDKALELLVYLEQQGVRQIYCVPPVKVENEGNAFSFLKDAFQYLQQQYSGNISLRLSARYRLDEGFPALLEKGDLLTIGGGKELLVDMSPLQQPEGLSEMIHAICRSGYIPVLMQPERSLYWGTEDYLHLRESGCRLMLNLYSLFGYNGDGALNYSRMLLRKEWYTYLCSGREDTKVMRYGESFSIEDDDDLAMKLQEIERNSRLLWSATENG